MLGGLEYFRPEEQKQRIGNEVEESWEIGEKDVGVGGECDVGTLDDAVGKGQSAGEGEEEVEEVEGLLGGPAALGDAPVNTNELEEGGG